MGPKETKTQYLANKSFNIPNYHCLLANIHFCKENMLYFHLHYRPKAVYNSCTIAIY